MSKETSIASFFMDYRPYSEQGFFISQDPYPGEYTPIGQMKVIIYPAIKEEKRIIADDGIYGDGLYKTILHYESIPADKVLQIAVQKAKEKGANGICNLEWKNNYEISFLCILIKDNITIDKQ